MIFGKSEEQKRLEKEQRQKQIELENKVISALKEIYVFPGSKEEFEDFIGYQTEWVDLREKNKGLIWQQSSENPFRSYNFELQKKIVDLGVVALVNAYYGYKYIYMGFEKHVYYGMPVRRKLEDS